MKLAGIIFLIAIIIYFFRSLRKNKNKEIEEKKIESKKEEEKKERNGDESKNKIWNKKSSYVWLFILQFVVLNFIYPGGWFEVKTLFWFFAQRNSDKYVALKDINTLLEKDEKQKISSVRAEIKKIEGKTKLTENDKRRLDELTNEIANVGKPTPPLQKIPAKPKEVEQTITIPISEDLKGGAFKSWFKPDGYVGKTSKRNAQYCAKIVEFNEKKLIVLYQTDKKNSDTFDGRIDCDHKSNGFYEGEWSDNGKSGFIILSPFYVGNIVDYFKGDEFNVNGSKSIPCWITGRILTF